MFNDSPLPNSEPLKKASSRSLQSKPTSDVNRTPMKKVNNDIAFASKSPFPCLTKKKKIGKDVDNACTVLTEEYDSFTVPNPSLGEKNTQISENLEKSCQVHEQIGDDDDDLSTFLRKKTSGSIAKINNSTLNNSSNSTDAAADHSVCEIISFSERLPTSQVTVDNGPTEINTMTCGDEILYCNNTGSVPKIRDKITEANQKITNSRGSNSSELSVHSLSFVKTTCNSAASKPIEKLSPPCDKATLKRAEDFPVSLVLTQASDEVQIIGERTVPADEPEYTPEQVKQLKRAIKKFFNKINLDSFDPAKLKLKSKEFNLPKMFFLSAIYFYCCTKKTCVQVRSGATSIAGAICSTTGWEYCRMCLF